MSWTNIELGSRPGWLRSERWAYGSVIGIVGGIVSIWGSMWIEAAIFFAVAIVLGLVALSKRRAGEDGESRA